MSTLSRRTLLAAAAGVAAAGYQRSFATTTTSRSCGIAMAGGCAAFVPRGQWTLQVFADPTPRRIHRNDE
jgi:hypothetical protein